MKKISVIIPAFNEEKNLSEIIRKIQKLPYKIEIIVVDDGSIDETYQVAKETGVQVFRFKKNKGKGTAFRKGINKSTGDIIIQIDADLQFLPEDIPKLIEPLLNSNADITFGSRFLDSSEVEIGSISKINLIANRIESFLVSLFSGTRITDVQAGFKAFTRDVIKKINFKEDRFNYEAEITILALKKRLKILDIPITYKQRFSGKSNINFFKDTFLIFKTILNTWLFCS